MSKFVNSRGKNSGKKHVNYTCKLHVHVNYTCPTVFYRTFKSDPADTWLTMNINGRCL